MKALSIRQPWAWLILHAGKDIENRSWPTNVRGRVLIHAAKGMTRAEYGDAMYEMWASHGTQILPSFEDLARGGIVGSVLITDCVHWTERSPRGSAPLSKWFVGPYGFVLANPEPLEFTPCRGRLGFFDVPLEMIQR